MQPTVGRIVHYKLSQQDADEVNRRRTGSGHGENWPEGAQAHTGNSVKAGDVFPMIITVVHSESMVNGQVFLDGNDTLWVTSRSLGENEFDWNWPPRV